MGDELERVRAERDALRLEVKNLKRMSATEADAYYTRIPKGAVIAIAEALRSQQQALRGARALAVLRSEDTKPEQWWNLLERVEKECDRGLVVDLDEGEVSRG